jgi:S1 RNA binding domain protein
MELTVGAILEGTVKTITNFGAFISLPENKTGMVHISEVANAYVSDIRQHLTEGQAVKVVVIGAENGKINLSIKRLEAKPQRENTPRPGNFRAPAQGQPQNRPAPKAATAVYDYDSDPDAKETEDHADAVADEIASNLEALVGTTEDTAPKAEPKHPTEATTTSKFANLQFGRNYDPTNR